ncbi:hypothetical protein UP09_12510 [Bradyrhizobium sp. LTSP885]|uniref:hypothetical protein n=1 Tax=Bradyrhizobium sp. LTSP885 TaxID=1619232 RepID=UPI0005C8A695|nr:hypothetical protein [Bradyrhizobium sp. LTSP885]KJC46811.1 hypothetical protein UP09_12510 [Bradyrhizobium sp. LTSP885]
MTDAIQSNAYANGRSSEVVEVSGYFCGLIACERASLAPCIRWLAHFVSDVLEDCATHND